MLLVGLDALTPGMKVAQPILHPDREDLLLLNKDYVLDHYMIRRIEDSGVMHVWISVPGFDDVKINVDPQIAQDHIQLYRVLSQSI